MNDFTQIGKYLIIFGLIIFVVGIIFIMYNKISFLGKLPGDLIFKKGNTTVYIPIATSIIVSVILTIILNICSKK